MKNKKQKRTNLSMIRLFKISANFCNYDKRKGQVMVEFFRYLQDHKNDKV